MYDNVIVDRDGKIATVTVDRPEKRNAMDIPTRKELRGAFEDVVDDDAIRVIVLRGAGEGNFIAGGDIQSFAEHTMLSAMEYIDTHAQGLYNYVANVPKPVIAGIDGHAFGGGLEISCAADVRVAQTGVKMGLTEVGLGILPAGGGTQRLTELVGASIAKDMILTGKAISAERAKEIGLVNYLHDEDGFEEGLYDVADEIADNAPIALKFAKASVNRAMNLEPGLDFERAAGTVVFGTEDKQEGAEAFLEDRDPEFEGR
ncbi:MAG: enoyl-CoA hydratase/isomerase family protein [Salinirussus sp.]